MSTAQTRDFRQLSSRIASFSALYDLDGLDQETLVADAITVAQHYQAQAHPDPEIALLAIFDQLVARQRYEKRKVTV